MLVDGSIPCLAHSHQFKTGGFGYDIIVIASLPSSVVMCELRLRITKLLIHSLVSVIDVWPILGGILTKSIRRTSILLGVRTPGLAEVLRERRNASHTLLQGGRHAVACLSYG